MSVDALTSVVSSSTFMPFGSLRSGGPVGTERTFTGQVDDAGTVLMFYNARYYDPVVGRFTQADSVLDCTNRYTYVRNNPTMFADPTGRSAEEARRARCGFHGTRCGNGAIGRAQTMALNAGASTGIPVVDGVIDALGDSLPG